MRRTPLVIGNWKMHKTVRETENFIKDAFTFVNTVKDVEIGVAPPFTSLYTASILLMSKNLTLCAQDVHWEKEGAFTGEVSPGMLKELGVKYVIAGHSERRHIFGENDGVVNRKIKAIVEFGMLPVLCVGETLEEREKGRTLEMIRKQLGRGFKGINTSSVVVAYEPVWAIGTGRTATPEMAEEVHEFIREELMSIFGEEGRSIRILYGGSVKPDNAEALISMEEIDGFLVGGASLTPESFFEIIKRVQEYYNSEK